MISAQPSILLRTDSYKVSHWMQFPEGMDKSFYYIESRGGKYNETMVAGLHYATAILAQGVTITDVNEAREFYSAHFGQDIFNYEGWKRIVEERDGKIPVRIRAVPEGIVVPVRNVLATIETDEGFGDVAGFLETFLLRAMWYPTTVATISFSSKVQILHWLRTTMVGTDEDLYGVLNFRLHDFGARGVSSGESAQIGGLSHLYNFMGTDTVESLWLARKLFATDMAGYSIPAREHSTTTCYLREGEYDAFMNSVENFGGGLFAVVIDSYSTKAALEWLTTNQTFIDKLTEKGGVCVLRPDSGDPLEMVMLALDTVAKNVGHTVNEKGYKVLDPRFRVIQGDGVDGDAIVRILQWMCEVRKYSAENLAFGMGGGLLQHCDRDTQRFAMKCSAMRVNGEWRDVYKSPETDPQKRSKAGRLDLILTDEGRYETVVLGNEQLAHPKSAMMTVFEFGERTNLQLLSDIRKLSDLQAEVRAKNLK